MRKIAVAVTAALALALVPVPPALALSPAERAAPVLARPAEWAQPVAVAGVPNLFRVTATFYRSAQPEPDGFRALVERPGIRTVVSLRNFNFHKDQEGARGTSLKLVNVPINTWAIRSEHMVAALAAIRRAERDGPVLLHCHHGADRTGLVAALYRVLYQGWSREAALAEMKEGHFGYHAVWANIPRFLMTVDTVKLKAMVEKAVR